jgi:hypothetical protein
MDIKHRRALGKAYAAGKLTKDQALVILSVDDLIESLTEIDEVTIVPGKEDLVRDLAEEAIFDVMDFDWSNESGEAYSSARMQFENLVEQRGLKLADLLTEEGDGE